MGDKTIGDALHRATRYLAGKGIPQARRDAEILLCDTLERPLAFLLAHPEDRLAPDQEHRFDRLVERRGEHFPMQYLRGYQEFYGRDFKVDPSVLIPRPETEILVATALRLLDPYPAARVVDVGTGSGCIAVTLACERPDLQVTAIDSSSEALRVAMENARRLGAARQVRFRQGNLLEPVSEERFQLVVSNPPYVAEGDPDVEFQVKQWEPAEALFSGSTGLEVITALLTKAPNRLADDGWLLIEIGRGQERHFTDLARVSPLNCVETVRDLAGNVRVGVFRNRRFKAP